MTRKATRLRKPAARGSNPGPPHFRSGSASHAEAAPSPPGWPPAAGRPRALRDLGRGGARARSAPGLRHPRSARTQSRGPETETHAERSPTPWPPAHLSSGCLLC